MAQVTKGQNQTGRDGCEFQQSNEPGGPAFGHVVDDGGVLLGQGKSEYGIEQLMGLGVAELQLVAGNLSYGLLRPQAAHLVDGVQEGTS